METKKKPKGDLEKRRNSFLLLGLVIVLSLVYAGFELYATSNNKTIPFFIDDDVLTIDPETIKTDEKNTPPPKKDPKVDIQLKYVNKDTEIDLGDLFKVDIDIPYIEPLNNDIEIIIPEPDDIIVDFVPKMPEFPGGEKAMYEYIKREIKYPTVCQQIGISGTVLVEFVVEKTGNISNVKVLVPAYPDLDQEAIRVITGFPKWTPGYQLDKPVRVKYQVPIKFQLN